MGEEDYVAGNPTRNGTAALVVVSGCSGGGKSTLLKEMAVRGYPVQPEPGRQIVKEQLSIGGEGLPWENTLTFIELCVSRALFFYNTAAPTPDKPAIFDRSILDNLSAFGKLGVPVPPYLTEAVRRYRYASRVFLVPPWKELFSSDTERRHSFEDAEAEYVALLATYQANGYEVVIIPKGTVSDRAAFLERYLQGEDTPSLPPLAGIMGT